MCLVRLSNARPESHLPMLFLNSCWTASGRTFHHELDASYVTCFRGDVIQNKQGRGIRISLSSSSNSSIHTVLQQAGIGTATLSRCQNPSCPTHIRLTAVGATLWQGLMRPLQLFETPQTGCRTVIGFSAMSFLCSTHPFCFPQRSAISNLVRPNPPS